MYRRGFCLEQIIISHFSQFLIPASTVVLMVLLKRCQNSKHCYLDILKTSTTRLMFCFFSFPSLSESEGSLRAWYCFLISVPGWLTSVTLLWRWCFWISSICRMDFCLLHNQDIWLGKWVYVAVHLLNALPFSPRNLIFDTIVIGLFEFLLLLAFFSRVSKIMRSDIICLIRGNVKNI